MVGLCFFFFTETTPIPTLCVLATQRDMIKCQAIQIIESHQQMEKRPKDVDLSPILLFMGSDSSDRLSYLSLNLFLCKMEVIGCNL